MIRRSGIADVRAATLTSALRSALRRVKCRGGVWSDEPMMDPDSIIAPASLETLAADRSLANASRALVAELEAYCERWGLSLDGIGWTARIDGKNVAVGVGSDGRWLTHTFRSRGEKGARTRWQKRR